MELLNYARGNFCGMWVFAYSWGCCFVDAPVFSFSKKDNSSKFVFVENVNSLGRATQEYHENWATANSNDFTVLVIWKSEVLNMCEYALSEEKNTKFSNTLWQHLFFFLSEGCINNTFINEFHCNWFNIHVNIQYPCFINTILDQMLEMARPA